MRGPLFDKFGFKCVGGMVDGRFDNNWNDITDLDAIIYVDFKNYRVMIDSGDDSDPIFLTGNFTSEEREEYYQYVKNLEEEIASL